MAYVYCDSCGVGFHSNVRSCPQCGSPARRTFEAAGHPHHHPRWMQTRTAALREDVEQEVREAIYGWHSGTVELRRPEPEPTAAEPTADGLEALPSGP